MKGNLKRSSSSRSAVRPKRGVADRRIKASRAIGFPVVGIGASAGGLEAFQQLLQALPLDTGMGFVLVQHLDPDHESALAQILSRATSLPVRDITSDEPVRANHVYIIPRDTNLTISGGGSQACPPAADAYPPSADRCVL